MQERRKVEMQLAAEAEAASKAKANLLRENVRKANQRVLVEAQRLKAEGRATREAASQKPFWPLCATRPLQGTWAPRVVTPVLAAVRAQSEIPGTTAGRIQCVQQGGSRSLWSCHSSA